MMETLYKIMTCSGLYLIRDQICQHLSHDDLEPFRDSEVFPELWLACSVHPNLGNRHFIHVSIELQLKGSNQNPNLSNRHFMSQLNYN